MRIQLHDNYQNASGVRLSPGEYDSADERLQGLAMYLLMTDHASIVPDAPVGDVPPRGDESDGEGDDGDRDEEDVSGDDADYQAMTKGQLLNIAAAGGIELSERLTKQAIIDALIAHGKK